MSHIINDQKIESLVEKYPLTIVVKATAGDDVIYLDVATEPDEATDLVGAADEAYRSFLNRKFEEESV